MVPASSQGIKNTNKQELHYFELSQSSRSSRGRVQIQDVQELSHHPQVVWVKA